MTLLHIDGFEAGDYAARTYAGITMTRDSRTRFGYGYSVAITGGRFSRGISPPSNKVTIGYAVNALVYPNITTPIIGLYGDAGSVEHARVTMTSTGGLILNRGATPLGVSTSGSVIATNTWNFLELTATISDTIGVMSLRLNGTEILTFNGDTRNGGVGTLIDGAQIGATNLSPGGLIDDMYILNDAGAAPCNAPLGDVRVQTLIPTGPGSAADLTPVGVAANWDNVDELPPSMTDYNYSSTTGHRDTYAMSDLVLGTAVIYGVAANAYALKNDAGARSLKNTVRVGGTTYAGAATALSTSAATTTNVWQTSPATSAAWTPTEVNAAESGVEVA